MSTHAVSSSDAVSFGKRPLLYDVTGAGQPIVLVPGTLTGWASWVMHADRLSTHRKVIRVQLRNVELAEAGEQVPESYGIESEISGLESTVDQLGLDRFDLAGWSLGGLVSLAFAMRFPERVRSLTLIEPAATWVFRAAGHTETWVDEMEAEDRRLSGKEVTIDDLKRFLVRAGVGTPETDIEAHPRWPLMVQNRQVLSTVGTVWDYIDSMDRLRALRVPILIVMGQDSPDIERLIVETIARSAPNATLLELPGDHSCHIQEIDRFMTALEQHLGA